MIEPNFKTIPKHDNLFLINTDGTCIISKERVINKGKGIFTKPKKELTQFIHRKGYKIIHLSYNGKTVKEFVHRLVALTFIPNVENKLEINHINGIKTDNRIENLEWCTCKENINHAFKNNLNKSFIHDSKYVEKVIKDYKSLKSLKKTAAVNTCSINTIRKILLANNTIILKAKNQTHGQSTLSKENVLLIRKLYKTGKYKQTDLTRKFNSTRCTINRVINNKTYNYD